MAPPVRVAVTLEQCWHRVPGGTATAALDAVRALQAGTDLDLVGVAARHRALPPAPWTPPIP
ncbi:MAG: glycosyltransferase family 4 protein, partial [Acidimicrobiales bacterium]